MRVRRRSTSRSRSLVLLVAAFLVWTSITSVVTAAADKSFSASVSAGPLVAGAWYGAGARALGPITLTITNTSNQAQLGSANVTLPPGLTLTGAATSSSTGTATANLSTNTVELRTLGLQPRGSFVATVAAQVECAANHTAYVWTFQVKQANDFNGTPGNDLVQDAPVTSTIPGNCGLSFTKQPAHSEKSPTVITSQVFQPAGDAVTVSVVDAAGLLPVTWWVGTIGLDKGNDPTAGDVAVFTGGTAGSAVNGSRTFAPTIDISATGYTVIANATAGNAASQGIVSGLPSQSFNIVDVATICGSTGGCTARAGRGQKTEAVVDASPSGAAGDLVILSINDPTVTLTCRGYTASSDLVVFDVTKSDGAPSLRAKTATLTLQAVFVNKSASKYQVCFQGATGVPLLLPTCAAKTPVPPCVVSKALDKFKNLVIVVSAPAGDPKLNF